MPYKTVGWLIREALPEELNFIYASWLNSYYRNSLLGKSCRKSIFFNEYPYILDFILNKPSTKVLVAYFEETPTVILSYLVFEPLTLHYLFTKEVYQGSGIAESLFLSAFLEDLKKDQIIDFTHRTLMSELIIHKYQDRLNFNPFKLYEKIKSEGENK